MKKSIIVLALALLMVGSVFANSYATAVVANTGSPKKVDFTATSGLDESTKVTVNLSQNPRYVFGITDKDHKFNATNNVLSVKNDLENGEIKYNEAPVVEVIQMTADLDNLVLNSIATGTYYVSYWFYECNEKVALYAKIDSALTTSGEAETGKKKYIDYKADITVGTSIVTLESNGANTDKTKTGSDEKLLITSTPTDELGKVECDNLALALGPKSTSDSLATNVVGDYESTITLTLKAGV